MKIEAIVLLTVAAYFAVGVLAILAEPAFALALRTELAGWLAAGQC